MMKVVGKFVVFGSINVDYIFNFDVFLMLGEIVIGYYYQVVFGGKGVNQVVVVGCSGVDIVFIVCIGDDDIGECICCQLVSDKIDVVFVCVVVGEVIGVVLIFVNVEGENVIGIYVGVNVVFFVFQVEVEKECIVSVQVLLMQLELLLESVIVVVKIVYYYYIIVVLNFVLVCELLDELLVLVDIIIFNEIEVEKLIGIWVESDEDVVKVVNVLYVKGIGMVMIIFGSCGVWFSVEGESCWILGFCVQVIDIIVVGDIFNGVLVIVLLEGIVLLEVICFVYVVVVIVVICKGVQLFVFWCIEIDEFLV